MIGEASFYGLYLPWFMLLCGVALGINWLLRRLLAAAGVYRWVWHPALFDLGVFVLLLYGLVRLTAPAVAPI